MASQQPPNPSTASVWQMVPAPAPTSSSAPNNASSTDSAQSDMNETLQQNTALRDLSRFT
nr:uncharacterized protein CI109_002989 [Kwoniella shandongensis]KAA5528828.1 hypothetical protein CI109_002989 [Kwoniella shandongensis]